MTAARTDVLAVEITFDEPTEYVDRNLATASWWDRYLIQPGTYRVEWEISYGYTRPVIQYGRARVDAVLVESYRENRLFTAVSADHKTDLAEKTTVGLGLHAFLWIGKAAKHEECWGGKVNYVAVVDEVPVDHAEIADPDDPMGVPAFGGPVHMAAQRLVDGTYEGYGHGRGREGKVRLVVKAPDVQASWL